MKHLTPEQDLAWRQSVERSLELLIEASRTDHYDQHSAWVVAQLGAGAALDRAKEARGEKPEARI